MHQKRLMTRAIKRARSLGQRLQRGSQSRGYSCNEMLMHRSLLRPAKRREKRKLARDT